MKIEKHYSLEIADEIVKNLLSRNDKFGPEAHIESFCNGREQGYSVVCYDTGNQVSFAQYRTSDSIVVYFNKSKKFDNNNHPLDWEKSRGFQPGMYDDAADFIISVLKLPMLPDKFAKIVGEE